MLIRLLRCSSCMVFHGPFIYQNDGYTPMTYFHTCKHFMHHYSSQVRPQLHQPSQPPYVTTHSYGLTSQRLCQHLTSSLQYCSHERPTLCPKSWGTTQLPLFTFLAPVIRTLISLIDRNSTSIFTAGDLVLIMRDQRPLQFIYRRERTASRYPKNTRVK
jgi:hypothetical protein